MNQHDRDNLNFLLNVDSDTFDDWLEQIEDDDVTYALELIKRGQTELLEQAAAVYDDITDFSDAKLIIEKLRIKGFKND